jgi:hypothetical protein
VSVHPYASARPPDVGPVTIFHRPLRREFAALSALVARVPATDRRAGRVVAEHAAMMLALLREHLAFEDALLWPPLRRHTRIYAELITAMETRNTGIAALSVLVERGLLEYAIQPGGAVGDRLAGHLRRLAAAVGEHVELEASEILPLAVERLPAAERDWRHVTFVCRMPRDLRPQMWRAGVLLEEATADERRGLLRGMPVGLRLAWRLVGNRLYASRVGGVRGLA